MALDPEMAAAHMRHHFDTVTDEQFIANVRIRNPDLAREMWGDMPASEILTRAKASPQSSMKPRRRGIAGALASFRRSVLRLFS